MKKLLFLFLLVSTPLWANSYATNFTAPPAPENPISEASHWINGGTTGLQWTNMRTGPGFAYGTIPGNGSGSAQYADSTATLTGSWTPNQSAIGTLNVPTNCTYGGTVFCELELRLNTTITANSITGYEFNISVANGNAYAQIVRWNGGLGSFTLLNSSGSVPVGVTGTVIAATNVGGLLTLYINGTSVVTWTDTTYSGGAPGIGAFLQGTTGLNANYGFSSFAAVDSNSILAKTCNQSDVSSAISSATEGETVLVPAGICTWTSGVTISGKGISVQGNGSGRIIAYTSDSLTVGTGTKTINIVGFSPGFSATSLVAGQVVDVTATGFESSYSMHGVVTGYSSGVLTVNVTSTTGSGSTHRWFISTQPATTIINNSSSTVFAITEDSSVNTRISGIKVKPGAGAADVVDFNYSPSGVPIVLQNCWIPQGTGDSTHFTTDRGVISNCSFDSPTFSMAPIAVHIKIDSPASGQNAWILPSYWGASDTNGNQNIYIESSDFEAYLNATDDDDNGRLVFRYNLMNNAGFGTHGADTSNYGQRYFEYYNNTGVFNPYSDGSTFNMNWWIFVRGGSYVVHDNTLTTLQSTDYGTKSDVLMITMNLQRNGGPNPCWGANFSSAGQYYQAPRQVGYGRVTGTGKANYPAGGVTNSATDSITYVGDPEPAYIWNNNISPLPNVGDEDYGSGNSDSCTGGTFDSTNNYVKINRDYFNGSTAKPGYTPYTYPHPLVAGGGVITPNITPPTLLRVTVSF